MATYPALSFLKHNGGRATTFTMNKNPALTTLFTKGIQTIRNHNSIITYIANTTNYSYYLPL
jgi:hypothetical protein